VPFEAFSFDDSVARTEASRARVPEGYYLVECQGFEPTAQDYAKSTGIWCNIRIIQGPDANPGLGVGGRMRDFNTVGKADAQFGLAQTLGAFGQAQLAKSLVGRSIPTYQHLQQLCAALSQRTQNAKAVALIADQPGQTRPFSGVEALYPATEWDVYRKASAVSVGAMPVAATVAAVSGNNASASDDIFADLDQRI
jgi:hypothetical protein